MGWNQNLIFYTCVAKGLTILAEHTSSLAAAGYDSGGIEALARRCIERAPPNHLNFSHTVRKRSYTLLFDDPFAYFVISHEDLGVVEALRFLDQVKRAFRDGIVGFKGVAEVTNLRFQGIMDPLFRGILGFDGFDVGQEKGSWCLKVRKGENKERNTVGRMLLVKPSMVLVKKKKKWSFSSGGGGGGGREVNGVHHVNCGSVGGNDHVDGAGEGLNNVGENGNVVSVREFSVTMVHKGGNDGGGAYLGEGRQKSKQIRKKHVWVVLVLDLVVCAVLFGMWLCVCRGFKCIDG